MRGLTCTFMDVKTVQHQDAVSLATRRWTQIPAMFSRLDDVTLFFMMHSTVFTPRLQIVALRTAPGNVALALVIQMFIRCDHTSGRITVFDLFLECHGNAAWPQVMHA
jgi:hypothetical protein